MLARKLADRGTRLTRGFGGDQPSCARPFLASVVSIAFLVASGVTLRKKVLSLPLSFRTACYTPPPCTHALSTRPERKCCEDTKDRVQGI